MEDAQEPVSYRELAALGATDGTLFSKAFFPDSVPMDEPAFGRDIWELLDGPARLINLQLPRGFSKTTRARIFIAKRVVYGASKTVLLVSKSKEHATNSLTWLKRQFERNRALQAVFGVKPSQPWTDSEIRVHLEVEDTFATILALGVMGSIRGVNIEDRRPDLIVLDDILDRENTATMEQRAKTSALIYGDLKQSLAPPTENPHSKMVMLQTPHNKEDATMKALEDPAWTSMRISCWTPETDGLPLPQQQSVWPTRFPSEILRQDKLDHIARNELHTFLREMECRVTSPETSDFRAEWLKEYDLPPEGGLVAIGIDPAPPITDAQREKGFSRKDYEAIAVVGRFGNDYYLLDYEQHRGHTPDWTISALFRLRHKWKASKVVCEATVYQRTLIWIIQKAQEHQGIYFYVEPRDDKRKKHHRIVDAIKGPTSLGHFYVDPDRHQEFITQYTAYPDVPHDDLLDAVAMAIDALSAPGTEIDSYKPIPIWDMDAGRQPLLYESGVP